MKNEYIKTFHEFNLNLYTISSILSCVVDTLNVDEEIEHKISDLIKFIDSKIDENFDDTAIKNYDVFKEKYYVETFYEKPNFNDDYFV